jgi:rSAM/selenodomain-associated transferase 1
LFPEARLLVFAKAPIPGHVKTRLSPVLIPWKAAALQAQLIRHTLTLATQARLCPVELWCSPIATHPFFVECQTSFSLTLRTQRGEGLGERMAWAFEDALSRCNFAVLIGCDCPTLTSSDLREALTVLQQGRDGVLGPAEDGGYVLIGLRRPAPALFYSMPWGGNTVLAETRARLRRLGLRFHELSDRWDVDRPEDLERLKETVGKWI